MRGRVDHQGRVTTLLLLIALCGIGGALVTWSLSWESAWPGPAPARERPAPGDGGGTRRRARSRDADAAAGGVGTAMAIVSHGEPDVPRGFLSHLWAAVRLVLLVVIACALVAGAIYWVATNVSRLLGHAGG